MGLIVNGVWVDKWYPTEESEGEFVRQESRFRNEISAENGALYKPEKGRYHLYVSLACPWAHRTLIFRKIKQLEDIISISIVQPKMLTNGWEFGAEGESLYALNYMYQLYLKSAPDYQGRVTVPVLWDKKTQTIVNNESAEIIRIFNSAFNDITGNSDDYYPEGLRHEIDQINDRIYETVNNGVYRAGFATTQAAYEKAYCALFETLDWLEKRLASQRYLVGDSITEADWRLFTTLIRFDAVYHGHFKCNRQRLSEFPNISHYVRALYQIQGVRETVDLAYTKEHYYGSHLSINPTGIIPLGPVLDFDRPHNRA